MAPKLLLLYSLLSGFAEISGATRWRPRHVSNPTINSLGNPSGLTTETDIGTLKFDIGVGVRDPAVETDFGTRDTTKYARKAQRRKPKKQLLFERVTQPARKAAPPKKAAPAKKVLKKSTPPEKATPPKKAAPLKKAPPKIVTPPKKAAPPKKARPGKGNKRLKPAQNPKKPAVHGGVNSRPQGDKVSFGSSSGTNPLMISVKAEDKEETDPEKKEIAAPIMLDVDSETINDHLRPNPDDGANTEESQQ
ncbi:hypothetical protein V2G26_003263 [Clonostachys chloroleuca]